MENNIKRKKHIFLKIFVLILIFCGLILYSGTFPVTMELLDEKTGDFLTLCKIKREFSAFSEFSSFSQKIINKAKYWIEIIKENAEEKGLDIGKVPDVLLTCAADFPVENIKITSYFGF